MTTDSPETALEPANDLQADMGNPEGEIFEDYEPPAPSAYHLGNNESRCGFLEAYIWRGEDALWESVNHIWNQMLPPKAERCTAIGLAAGTGGTGRKALIPFLRRALRESLDHDIPKPWGLKYPDLETFHETAMAYFAASHNHYEKTIQKYANLMNCGEPPQQTAQILQGPWIGPTHGS